VAIEHHDAFRIGTKRLALVAALVDSDRDERPGSYQLLLGRLGRLLTDRVARG